MTNATDALNAVSNSDLNPSHPIPFALDVGQFVFKERARLIRCLFIKIIFSRIRFISHRGTRTASYRRVLF